jgi:hypothetical protein
MNKPQFELGIEIFVPLAVCDSERALIIGVETESRRCDVAGCPVYWLAEKRNGRQHGLSFAATETEILTWQQIAQDFATRASASWEGGLCRIE